MALSMKQEQIVSKLIEAMVQDMPEELAAALLLIGVTLGDVEKRMATQEQTIEQLDLKATVMALAATVDQLGTTSRELAVVNLENDDKPLLQAIARIEAAVKSLAAKTAEKTIPTQIPQPTKQIRFEGAIQGSDGFYRKFNITEKE